MIVRVTGFTVELNTAKLGSNSGHIRTSSRPCESSGCSMWKHGLPQREPVQEDKQIDDRTEVPKMRLRKFDHITKVVKEHGGIEAQHELEWLLKLAKTNFAACYGTGTQGPDAHDAATVRLNTMLPLIEGGGEYISRICDWLYAQAKEKCTCGAPVFITGCDNAVATGEDSEDACTCMTGECPWTHHTGVFL